MKRERVAWVVVDRTGMVWEGSESRRVSRKTAQWYARKSSQHAPFTVVRVTYPWPPARKGSK